MCLIDGRLMAYVEYFWEKFKGWEVVGKGLRLEGEDWSKGRLVGLVTKGDGTSQGCRRGIIVVEGSCEG